MVWVNTAKGGVKIVKQVSFSPVIGNNTRLVILGSFPGVASLQAQQYYAYPRNQFWPIVGALLGEPDLIAYGYEDKLAFILANGVGLWDVYKACERQGSLDSNIRKGEANDLSLLLDFAPDLKVIAHNGRASAGFMSKTLALGVEVLALPSSSPAYASMRFEEKLKHWKQAFVLAGLR